MSEQSIGKQAVESFKQYLILEEKSRATIDKYIHDINKFLDYLKEVLMLMMISFYSIVNNVRNVCAFSLIGLALSEIVIKRKEILLLLHYIYYQYFYILVQLYLLL